MYFKKKGGDAYGNGKVLGGLPRDCLGVALKNSLNYWRCFMGKYSDNTASSGDSSSKAAEAEHDARNDATPEFFERGNDEKNSKPFPKDDDSGKAAGGFWSSIFG